MTADPPSRAGLYRAGWAIGLPALALFWGGATELASPQVTDALKEAVSEVVQDAGQGSPEPWLQTEIRGRDVIARGEASDAASRSALLSRLAAIPGLRRLVDRTGFIESASPFVWRLTRAATNRLELSGHRPAEIGSTAVTARITSELPDATLRDRSRAAYGAPPGFLAVADYAAARVAGLAPGAVATLNDTVLSIEGEAVDGAAYDAARTAFAAPPEGFSLGRVEIQPPSVEDFRFAVERRSDGGLALSGYVVSEAARAAILSEAVSAAEGARVDDQMQTARGLPPAIEPAALARFALRLAALVHEGKVSFDRGSLSVAGTAVDSQAVGDAQALLRDEAPANGIAAGRVDLVGRAVLPYRVRVRRDAESVTLTGHLPDQAARETVLATLRARLFRETIVDRTRLATGAPPTILAALTSGIGPLTTLGSGELTLSDARLSLTGESLYPENARRIGETLPRALPAGWSAEVSVTAPDAARTYDSGTCARMLNERVAGHPLRFAPGSSELRPDFYPVLDAVAALSKNCPAGQIEVVGHLDPPGTATPKPADPVPVPAPEPKPAKTVQAADPKAKSAKDQGNKGQGSKDKAAAKPGPKAEAGKEASVTDKPAAPEPAAEPDLARQRALAIVDYLQKAGVAASHAGVSQGGAPLPAAQGVGIALRS